MFELPEITVLAKQINKTLKGKTIKKGILGNSPHKFVWYNRTHEEFEKLTTSKVIGNATVKGKWMFVEVNPGYVFVLGECGGKVLYHPPGSGLPKKYHLYFGFNDDSLFTITTQMWGAMELYKKGEELSRKYVKDMRTTPVESGFTIGYFNSLIDEVIKGVKRSVKGLLTQDQLIPGLGNAIAQDIMFKAHLHPKHPIQNLDTKQRKTLFDSIKTTIKEIITKGGRYDEYDLYGKHGSYVRLMDKKAAGNPCPECSTIIEKMQYLGGACYYCPVCQKLD